jgi:hypothetical protein
MQELLEQRLKEDVVNELSEYDHKLLLHGETSEGDVLPLWEDVDLVHVMTLKEVRL